MKVYKVVSFVLLVGLLFVILGCSNRLGQKDNQQAGENNYTKDKIAVVLDSNKEIVKTSWSPDATMVVYIQTGKPDKNGLDEAYCWKVGEEKGIFIRNVSPTTQGFTWSPNSQYFLISEKLGDGAVSSIVKADSLTEEGYKIKSISIPVWSADSMYVAYGFEQHDYGDSWGSLEVYQLGQDKGEYIWKAMNHLYQVDYWDAEGNIGYTEIVNGQAIHKTTKNVRPDISGVHLGDTKVQVQAALGSDYQETPPGEETLNFPEPVYRWTYNKGYQVFIGQDTGKVWEVIATYSGAETNLGSKIGDRADRIFEIYRPKYTEPESIHGGKLYGTFKVEGAAALVFAFDLPEGSAPKDIKPENRVIRMVLTYSELLDDSF